MSAILCLVKREDVRGTILEGHFTWIIRTFLWALIAWAVARVLAITFIGIPLACLIWTCVYVWSIYRVVVGWLKLSEGRRSPIPKPGSNRQEVSGFSAGGVLGLGLAGFLPEPAQRLEQARAQGLEIDLVVREIRDQPAMRLAEIVVGQVGEQVMGRVIAQADRRP